MDAEMRALLLRTAELLDRLGAFARYVPPDRANSAIWMQSGDALLNYGHVREAKALADEISERLTVSAQPRDDQDDAMKRSE